MSAFATGGFYCTSTSGKVTVSGIVGAGATLLDSIYVTHSDLSTPVILNASMKWIDYSKSEIKISSYNAMDDIERLNLKVENGKGTLNINLSDMNDGDDIIIRNIKVTCELE